MAMSLLQNYCLLFPQYCSLNNNNYRKGTSLIRVINPPRCLASNRDTAQTSRSRPGVGRALSAKDKPVASIWDRDFVQALEIDHTDEEETNRAQRWKLLEEDVKKMIDYANDGHSVLTTLELIDDIQRLGVGYRFEESIRGPLDSIMKNFDQITDTTTNSPSLHFTALSFRLLRQNGFQVSQDVFNRFTDRDGRFKACHCNDVIGMLSLYEASYLGFEGESLLDEALEFTSTHLKNTSKSGVAKSKGLEDQVIHALEMPLHRRMLRLEARWHIEAYRKRADAYSVLLEFAVLDFNMVQQTLQGDLKEMSRWWEDLGLAQKLFFSRDRMMECFFWSVGIVFEPEFSNIRKGLTKVAALVVAIDDVYDVYGTLDELELFTCVVERWDVNAAAEILPDYMKLVFLALYNTVNQMVYDTLKEQGEDVLQYLKKSWADMCKAFLKEAEWRHHKCTPTFEEYLDNGWISASGVVTLVHTYFLLNQKITEEGLKCLENQHNIFRWPSLIFRLSNDVATTQSEIERGETATSISCKMRENFVSEECARKSIRNLIDDSWKKLNKDGFIGMAASGRSSSPFTKQFVEAAINLARIAQCLYQDGDGFGAPDTKANNRILRVIVQPIQGNGS